MWKSVIYKEWLKTRWFIIAFVVLGVLVVGYIFLNVRHNFKFTDPNNYWYTLLFMKLKYFGYLKFAPIAGALAISIAQFFPETVDKRIKLTFHLPLNENKVLLVMMLFGSAILFATYGLFLSVFIGFSSIYFPSNIVVPALVTITPWFLGGFAAYYFVALIVLEPVWKYRFLYILVATTVVPLFFESAATGSYAPANPALAIIVIVLSISLLFSGYRFRKGEM